MPKIITYQSPAGNWIHLAEDQVSLLEGLGVWPKDQTGQEYCSVSHGLHPGEPDLDTLTLLDRCGLSLRVSPAEGIDALVCQPRDEPQPRPAYVMLAPASRRVWAATRPPEDDDPHVRERRLLRWEVPRVAGDVITEVMRGADVRELLWRVIAGWRLTEAQIGTLSEPARVAEAKLGGLLSERLRGREVNAPKRGE